MLVFLNSKYETSDRVLGKGNNAVNIPNVLLSVLFVP